MPDKFFVNINDSFLGDTELCADGPGVITFDNIGSQVSTIGSTPFLMSPRLDSQPHELMLSLILDGVIDRCREEL